MKEIDLEKVEKGIEIIGAILIILYWIAMFYMIGGKIFFIPLNHFSVKGSKVIAVCIMIAFSLIGILFRRKNRFAYGAVTFDILSGIGFYLVVAYQAYYRQMLTILLSAYALYAVFCIGVVVLRKYKGRTLAEIEDARLKQKIIHKRIYLLAQKMRRAFGIVMILFMGVILNVRLTYGGRIAANPKNYKENSGFNENYLKSEYSLENNIESISKIRTEDTWKPLSKEEKLKVLQDICNCEANYLGMEQQITIEADHLNVHEMGYYRDSERKIVIDEQLLEEGIPEEVLNTCLHEMYHAWEYRLVELYLSATESQRKMRIFRHCDAYVQELKAYENGGEEGNFEDYYEQFLEKDSRDYALVMMNEYYDGIDALLGKQNEESETVPSE